MPEALQRPGDLTGRSLLGIFAHPDDESLACGGLLAWCSALGAELLILCLTRGEHGPRNGRVSGDAPAAALGAVRARELRDAGTALGAANVMLLDHEDGMLPWLDASRIEGDIEQIVERHQPEVVITFDEDGLYGHPDHVAVHERTTSAIRRMGRRAPALYYASLPPGAMQAVAQHATLVAEDFGLRATGSWAADSGLRAPGTGLRASGFGAVDSGLRAPEIFGIDAGAFGSGAPPPTLIIDVAAFAAHKLRALRCHETQMAGSAFALVGEQDASRLLGREQLRRADIGRQGPTFLDALATP